MAVFERGDIVLVNFEPVIGHEMRGAARPALVLIAREFNALGDVLVAPITQGGDFARYAGFAITLSGTGYKTQAVALINKVRMLNLSARGAGKIERVPAVGIDDALSRLIGMLEG